MSTCGSVTSVTSGVWKIEKMFTLQIKQIAVNKTDKNVQTYGKIVQNSRLDPDSVRFCIKLDEFFICLKSLSLHLPSNIVINF